MHRRNMAWHTPQQKYVSIKLCHIYFLHHYYYYYFGIWIEFGRRLCVAFKNHAKGGEIRSLLSCNFVQCQANSSAECWPVLITACKVNSIGSPSRERAIKEEWWSHAFRSTRRARKVLKWTWLPPSPLTLYSPRSSFLPGLGSLWLRLEWVLWSEREAFAFNAAS